MARFITLARWSLIDKEGWQNLDFFLERSAKLGPYSVYSITFRLGGRFDLQVGLAALCAS